MWRHVISEIFIIALIVICFLVSLDVSVFHVNYSERLIYLKCKFNQSGELLSGDQKDCCGEKCFYHASKRDSGLAQFWDRAVSTPLSYIFYPIGSLFVK